MVPDDQRQQFTSVPLRMTVFLLLGAACAVLLGASVMADSTVGGCLLVASAAGPLFILWHARRTARTNRQRA